jgi:hypothetical protein
MCNIELIIAFSLFHRLFGAAIAMSAILNALFPITSKMNSTITIIVRVLQGLSEVSVFTAL